VLHNAGYNVNDLVGSILPANVSIKKQPSLKGGLDC
jgi:hypothetical protein